MLRGVRRTKLDIKELLMLLFLKFEGAVGRYRLKEMLRLSEREGVVKRILADLRRSGYVLSGRPGSRLTIEGES